MRAEGKKEYTTQLFKQTYPLKIKVMAIAEFKIVISCHWLLYWCVLKLIFTTTVNTKGL